MRRLLSTLPAGAIAARGAPAAVSEPVPSASSKGCGCASVITSTRNSTVAQPRTFVRTSPTPLDTSIPVLEPAGGAAVDWRNLGSSDATNDGIHIDPDGTVVIDTPSEVDAHSSPLGQALAALARTFGGTS